MFIIEKKIKKIIALQLGIKIEKISKNHSYKNDLGIDSLDLVELIMTFEEKFEINIPDEDINKINTVEKTIKYIDKKINKN